MNLDMPYQVLFEYHLIGFCKCESAGWKCFNSLL
jgi:hypothetical protein